MLNVKFLIILPKNSNRYQLQLKLTFLFGFLILVLSESTLRYSTISPLSTMIYIMTPLVLFVVTYSFFIIKSKNA